MITLVCRLYSFILALATFAMLSVLTLYLLWSYRLRPGLDSSEVVVPSVPVEPTGSSLEMMVLSVLSAPWFHAGVAFALFCLFIGPLALLVDIRCSLLRLVDVAPRPESFRRDSSSGV